MDKNQDSIILPEDIGEYIRTIQGEKFDKDFADELGIPRSSLSAAKNRDYKLKGKTLEKLGLRLVYQVIPRKTTKKAAAKKAAKKATRK